MKNAPLAIMVFVALLPFSASAQDDKNFVTLTVENDMFGGTSDQDYTSGLRIGWYNTETKPPFWTDEFESVLPFMHTNGTTATSYSVGQNIFTPEDIESPVQDPDDRPWAAFLYGSAGMTTLFDGFADEYELTLGIVGPAAQGEMAQKNVHNLVRARNPNGWDLQLKNEPGLMFSWQRRWQGWQRNMDGLSFALTPNIGATAGNIYTYANTGGSFVISSQPAQWVDKPLMVRPSMPGSGYFRRPEHGIEWKLFAGVEGRAIARNIFLDGNTFTDSHSVDKKPFVADFSAGAGLMLGAAQVSYTMIYRTREFDTQDDPSVFGGISVGYNF